MAALGSTAPGGWSLAESPEAFRGHVESVVGRIDPNVLACRFLDAYRRELPAYRRLRSEAEGPLLSNISDTIRLALRWMVDSLGPTGLSVGSIPQPHIGALLKAPLAAAERGMPLVDLLRAYYLGSRIGIEALDEVATGEERGVLSHTATAIVHICDAMATAITRIYVHERPDLHDAEEQDCRVLLDAIVTGDTLTERMRATLAGMRVQHDDRYLLFAAALRGEGPQRHIELARSLRGAGVLAVCDGGAIRGLTNGAGPLERLADEPGMVVVRTDELPSSALRTGLKDVRTVLRLRLAARATGMSSLTDYIPELLVARSPHLGAELRSGILARLEPHPDLVATLRTYLDRDLSRAATARALHIHRNTLHYRLRRIEELTGRRLDWSRDLTLLYLASHSSPEPTGGFRHPSGAQEG